MMSRSSVSKFVLLGALYLSQGLPFGFFTQALPVMMRQSGRSLKEIGLTSLLAVPWALKFLWAPWVDSHGSKKWGFRRSWIIPLQLMTAVVLVTAAWFEPDTHFSAVFGVVLFVNALSATQDIATDGLAVEILNHGERGLANGLQVGAYRLGMVLGGGVLLIFYSSLGWKLAFLSMAVAIGLSTIPIVLHRESARHNGHEATAGTPSTHFFRLSGVWPILAMLFIFKFGEALASAMMRPFLTDNGLALDDIGWLLGTVGFVSGLLGALLGGWLAGRFARKAALLACATAQAATLATYVVVALGFPSKVILAGVVAAEYIGGGMATAALFTCMMDWCRPVQSGSDYTVQASTVVISSGAASALSGFSAHHLGYPGHFALAFLLGLVALGAVWLLFPKTAPHERAAYAA